MGTKSAFIDRQPGYPVPPIDVAGTIAVLRLTAAHKAALFINARWPAKAAA